MSTIKTPASEDVAPRPAPAVAPRLTRALVVTRQVGVSSEVWICRQVLGFSRIRPEVVCWEREPSELHPMPGVPIHQLPYTADPTDSARRWIIRLQNAANGNYYGSVGAEAKSLRSLIRASGAEVILCHFGHTALRVLPAARACGVPVVAHFHGLDVSSALRNRWYRASLLRSLPRFAGIVVVGSHQRKWMTDHGVPAHRIHLIPCGVPTAFFTPAARSPASGRIVVSAVCRLVPWKGVAETIRAIALARRQGADVELRVAGTGSQRAELENLVQQLNLSDRVVFLGAQTAEQVRELFTRSDIFVQHSLTSETGWQEGFGVSLAEAAAMGLPVLATRSGGIPDQVVDGVTGVLVKERDILAMGEAITRLAADADLRHRLGQAGRARMIQHFDTDRQVERLEDVMLDAAHASRNRSGGGTLAGVTREETRMPLLSTVPLLA